jgi:hypothetical protein
MSKSSVVPIILGGRRDRMAILQRYVEEALPRTAGPSSSVEVG